MNYHSTGQENQILTGDGLNLFAVKKYLSENIENFPNEPLEVEQFSTGLSNLTFLIRSGNWEAVLRRPPNGPLPPKAHDMKRESDFLEKLHPYFPFVPKPYLLCQNESVIGVPFYIMERKIGVVLDETFPPNQEVSKEQLQKLSYQVVDTLAELHQVNFEEAGLSDFGYAHGFLERQVHGWIKRYKQVETHHISYFEKVSNWLVNNIPLTSDSAIIHNDYKLNNMLLSSDLTEIKAVLDWEIATIGDPIFDLAGALAYWIQEDDPESLKESLPSITATPGFISRNEFLNQYELKTKKSVPALNFYMTLNYFKLAIALQQIYYRWKIGQSEDERFKNLDQRVTNLMKHAYEMISSKL
ncbi:phosphotransferase family protein [Psychrobacillus sp. OK032]|uniref:phosphotransferase family protein n=1 Tax=Psychrobacillus sp. OK032 TaxID=1884358 RepID=UPI0008B23428|nr:phosphotransferase family protein [Psychrobacillus sp. OK032]SER86435.1 Predicted kinase, aminoglycoside phosphotransferase (APT) family [Psychrobacillus sp. OK032]